MCPILQVLISRLATVHIRAGQSARKVTFAIGALVDVRLPQLFEPLAVISHWPTSRSSFETLYCGILAAA